MSPAPAPGREVDSSVTVVNARFLTQKLTGTQRFATELCRRLKVLDPSLVFLCPQGIVQREAAEELGALEMGRFAGHFWEQVELPVFLARRGFPLLVNLVNTAPILYPNKIVTVHDLAFLRFPATFTLMYRLFYNAVTPLILKWSKRVVTVSHFSAREIFSAYGWMGGLRNKTSVVHNAVATIFRELQNGEPVNDFSAPDPRERYILALGTIAARKNLDGLIRAFNGMNDPGLKLFVIGDSDGHFKRGGAPSLMSESGGVRPLGRLTDPEIAAFYDGAECFVFPSFYEGFGLPPLEAQFHGVPVIVSNRSCLPEIFRESALYCDPESPEDIRAAITKLIGDPKLRNEMARRGRINAERYNWDDSARKLIEIIRAARSGRAKQ